MAEFSSIDSKKLEALIEEAAASGGAERANYQLFILGLADALGLPRPQMAAEENQRNDYVFERRVDFKHPNGTTTPGYIDLYRRGHFILEAKQSAKRQGRSTSENQLLLLPEDASQMRAGHAKRGTRTWDQVMLAARRQAEDYARALPVEHGYPPFLLIVDVGHVIEVYADFSGQGKNYAHFPDRRSYRIHLDELREPPVQARLSAIWRDPLSLDPAKISAEVTRDIAERLANIAKRLEGKHDPRDVAEFLMRCLFTMFAEDVELLPKQSFENLLEQLKPKPESFVPALEHLWSVMDKGGYEPRLNLALKRFNGTLFKERNALPLDADGIHELWVASKRDWRDVEPAIFGTLLERALDPRERAKLGAHYTPRAYVERLILPTVIEPLRNDWADVQVRVEDFRKKKDERGALRVVQEYHRKLCMTRVFDPACGTGNFLYVSLELMKRLEGEVLEAIAALGGEPSRIIDHPEMFGTDVVGRILSRKQGRFTVDPHQFHGLEINPRAVVIADLVLWIGYLKWQLKTSGLESITEPVLDAYGTINEQDAVLAYDERRPVMDEHGNPVTRWDGVTTKAHPITGEEVPDPGARVETFKYLKPRRAEWPKAEFIVGNPPFIGNKRMIERLGEDYVSALRAAYPGVPESVDLVMYWWHRCAELLEKDEIESFGLVTTSKIIQTFNRRVVDAFLSKDEISIAFAIDNLPWADDENAAAVRVSMTVCRKDVDVGNLQKVLGVRNPLSEDSELEISSASGRIDSMLRIGADLTATKSLKGNLGLAHQGVTPSGLGFRVSSAYSKDDEKVLPSYIIGRDLTQRRQERRIIDFYGLTEAEAKSAHPVLFQVVLDRVKPERDQNRRPSYRDKYWLFVEPRAEMRAALRNLTRQIVTTRTSRQRFFQFEPTSTLCDAKIIVIADESSAHLAVLSSRIHVDWSNRWAKLGAGNDPNYNHSECFNHFPFPASIIDQPEHNLALRLAELGERLDAFRKERLANQSFLTMTGLYNTLERVRELDCGCDVPSLDETEKAIYEGGLVSVLKSIHEDIDRAVFEAYGWTDLSDRLVGRPGATIPSPHKSDDQEAAEEELLTRLVALNLERQTLEKRGVVGWLRAEYQVPKFGHKIAEDQSELDVGEIAAAASKPQWPREALAQIRVVRDVLARAPAPAGPGEVSTAFEGRNTPARRSRIEEVLETLVATGGARIGQTAGENRYFVPR